MSHFIALDPDPPSDLLVLGQEENTIYLSWKCPQGGFEKFQVKNSATDIQLLYLRRFLFHAFFVSHFMVMVLEIMYHSFNVNFFPQ